MDRASGLTQEPGGNPWPQWDGLVFQPLSFPASCSVLGPWKHHNRRQATETWAPILTLALVLSGCRLWVWPVSVVIGLPIYQPHSKPTQRKSLSMEKMEEGTKSLYQSLCGEAQHQAEGCGTWLVAVGCGWVVWVHHGPRQELGQTDPPSLSWTLSCSLGTNLDLEHPLVLTQWQHIN
jgi:hypothetical protein